MRITMDSSGLEAARAGTWLQVHCRRCRRRGSAGPNCYGWKVGERPLREIVPLLRCLDCGARGEVRIWIVGRDW